MPPRKFKLANLSSGDVVIKTANVRIQGNDAGDPDGVDRIIKEGIDLACEQILNAEGLPSGRLPKLDVAIQLPSTAALTPQVVAQHILDGVQSNKKKIVPVPRPAVRRRPAVRQGGLDRAAIRAARVAMAQYRDRAANEVAMGYMLKQTGGAMKTYGVATCTGVAVTGVDPDGNRVAVLAHCPAEDTHQETRFRTDAGRTVALIMQQMGGARNLRAVIWGNQSEGESRLPDELRRAFLANNVTIDNYEDGGAVRDIFVDVAAGRVFKIVGNRAAGERDPNVPAGQPLEVPNAERRE